MGPWIPLSHSWRLLPFTPPEHRCGRLGAISWGGYGSHPPVFHADHRREPESSLAPPRGTGAPEVGFGVKAKGEAPTTLVTKSTTTLPLKVSSGSALDPSLKGLTHDAEMLTQGHGLSSGTSTGESGIRLVISGLLRSCPG